MRKALVTLLFLCLALPAGALAQEESTSSRQSLGFLAFQDVVPTEIVSVDPVHGRVIQTLVNVDTFFVGNFTPGESDGLDSDIVAQFDSIINTIDDEQHVFFRGTADSLRWTGRYSKIEFARLNRSLAESRAMWAKERAGMGRLLHPVTNYPGRGVIVYVATYEDVEVQLAQRARVDTTIVISHIKTTIVDTVVVPGAVRIGMGLGFEGVYTHEFEFNLPTAQFILSVNEELYLTLTGGYRPKDPSRFDALGDRSESIIAANLEWYMLLDDMVAVSVGYLSAYENQRAADEFVERVYGLTIGPRLRLLDYNIVLGLDLGYFDTSKLGVTKTNRQFGLAPFVRFNYIF